MAVASTKSNYYADAFQRAKRAAVVYGSIALSAISAAYPISITTASLSPASAQTLLVTPTLAPLPGPSMSSTPIPKEQCNFLFDTVTDSLEKHGKDYISGTTRASLRKFFISNPASKAIDCGGPREIAWETGKDYDLIIAFADATSGKFGAREVDFRMGYGFRPTAKATTPTVGQSGPTAAPGS
jgi:hypothetical protein